MEEIKHTHESFEEFKENLDNAIAEFEAILPTEYANDHRWRFIAASAKLLCLTVEYS